MMKKLNLFFLLTMCFSVFTVSTQAQLPLGKYELQGVLCKDPIKERSYFISEKPEELSGNVIRTLAFDFSGSLLITSYSFDFYLNVATFKGSVMKMAPSFACKYNRIDKAFKDPILSTLKIKEGLEGVDCSPNGGMMPSFLLNKYLANWSPVSGELSYFLYENESHLGKFWAISLKNEDMMLKKGMCATKSGQDINYETYYLFKRLE